MLDKFPLKTLEEIAARVGTPVYVYSADVLLRQVRAYRRAFPEALICYAMKANPSGGVCRLLARSGLGADVVSGGELFRALRAGFPPGRIVFSGVGKTREELDFALAKKVLLINVESAQELEALEAVARRRGVMARVSVRINPDIDPRTHKFISTGKSGSKFGVSFSEAEVLFRRAAASSYLFPSGAHIHLGSQIHSAGPYAQAARAMAAFVRRLASAGIKLSYVDMGGGWGAREGAEMAPPAALARALAPAASLPGTRLIIEPGRSIAAPAGLLLTRVLYMKKSGRKDFLVADAAMNDLVRPAFYGSRHPIVPLRPRAAPAGSFAVVGPVCETGDFIGTDVAMRRPEPGDLLAVMSAGAYGMSMSSNYNSRPRAAEVLVTGRAWKVVRRRESRLDLVRQEC
ncbi:MAG: lysA [Elusimicrobia bacterium]|nr:MAG: lysA [Elusimicrobiota bacterium]